MPYRFRGRGQITTPASRSGRGFIHDGRRVLVRGDNFQLTWNGPQVVADVIGSIENAFARLSVEGLAFMQGIVPVDTGATQESCFVTLVMNGARIFLVIGAGTPYAIYIELGTSSHEASPFIRPTFDYVVSRLPGILAGEVASRASRK